MDGAGPGFDTGFETGARDVRRASVDEAVVGVLPPFGAADRGFRAEMSPSSRNIWHQYALTCCGASNRTRGDGGWL